MGLPFPWLTVCRNLVTAMADRRNLVRGLLIRYGLAAIAVAMAVGVRELLAPLLGETLPRITTYPAIIVSAYFGGLGPGLLSALASTLIIDCFFTSPYGVLSLLARRAEGIESLIYLITTSMLAVLSTAFARARWRAAEEARALRVSEQALRTASEKLAAAVAASGTGTFRWNIRDGTLEWDQNLTRLFGIRSGEGARKLGDFLQFVHPEDRQGVAAAIDRCAGKGLEFNMEYRIVWPDGSIHWLTYNGKTFPGSNGRPLYMTGACVDITHRKESEQERERLLCEQVDANRRIEELAAATESHRSQLEAIIRSVDQGIVVADLHGNVLNMNPAALAVHGFRNLAEARKNLREYANRFKLFSLDGREIAIEFWPLSRVMRGESFSNCELRVRCAADGREWIANCGGSPVRDQNGQLMLAVLTVRDVTERRRKEQELRSAKQVAENASRAKVWFLATLSHELRTPLTPVLMAASAMEKNPDISPDMREELGLIRRNVELETQLIDDLLDLTRIASGKLELKLQPVAADALVRQAIQTCAADIQAKNIRLETDLAQIERLLMADPVRIQQVIWNLLRNSIKFTSSGGRISVRCAGEGEGQVVIEVADTGIGIEPEALTRIFGAFEQGDPTVTREFGGLGLGLAICKALVEKHGGRISAYSGGKGTGATFRVELPLAGVGETALERLPLHRDERVASEFVDADRQGGAGLRILLVEDHADTVRMLSRLLRMEGHAVETAVSVESALRLVEKAEFDLVISDIGLPDGSGLDMMRQLQSKYPLKGIVLSGYGTEEDVRRSKEAGFAEHLTKPLKYELLQAAIAHLALSPV